MKENAYFLPKITAKSNGKGEKKNRKRKGRGNVGGGGQTGEENQQRAPTNRTPFVSINLAPSERQIPRFFEFLSNVSSNENEYFQPGGEKQLAISDQHSARRVYNGGWGEKAWFINLILSAGLITHASYNWSYNPCNRVFRISVMFVPTIFRNRRSSRSN